MNMSRPSDPFDPDPDLDEDEVDELFRREGRSGDRAARGLSDFVRKTIESTVGSVQNTGTLSKEALQYVIQQGDRGRREVLRIVAAEVGDFLRQTDLSREVTKVLTSIQIDVAASVKFRPIEDGRNVEPSVSTDVAVGLVGGKDKDRDKPKDKDEAAPTKESGE
jgi:hypothetical protein